MAARAEALGARERKAHPSAYDPTVRTFHVKPLGKLTKEQQAAREAVPKYPGWTPRVKTCRLESCGERFMPTAPAQAYHTPECKLIAERAQRRVTDVGKRDRRRKRLEAKLGEPVTAAGRPVARVCALPGCDVEFTPTHPRSAYCSPEHNRENKKRLKRESARRARGSEPSSGEPTSASREVIKAIEGLPEATPAAYIARLWQLVNQDPNVDDAIYDRLERLLGLQPDPDITEQVDAATA